MKKSKFKIVEDLMLFLSQKQHVFGLCFIVSLIFITFAYKNSNLNADDTTSQITFEGNDQNVRTFYEETTNNGISTYENKKLLSCGINIESIFGISKEKLTLNTNLDYSLSDFKNNIKYSIDLYGIDNSEKLEEKALFKVYTSEIYNPDYTADVCTYDDNGNLLTGHGNQSDDVGYILCDSTRMKTGDCVPFPNDINNGSLECANYNVDKTNKKYCYSENHICNKYRENTDKNIVAIDKQFIDKYLNKINNEEDTSENENSEEDTSKGKSVKEGDLANYFYLFYKDLRPTDQEVKNIKDTVNCFQTFYNCDLTPYWNVKDVEEKLKDTGNSSITANEFVNVIIDGKGDDYYNNKAFNKIVNSKGIPLFVEDKAVRCCLKIVGTESSNAESDGTTTTDDKSCDYKLCFAEENKEEYIEYFKNSTIYKYIKGNTVKFFRRNISKQTCKNYLPDCSSVPTINSLYSKIDGKINTSDDEEQNSLYKAAGTSDARCLYAEGKMKNDKIEYSDKVEDKSKSYCSDLLMDENGELKLKYEEGLKKGADNCFLKSCIDLNEDELATISGKDGVYCSPYRYLRDYNKIGVTLDLKFFPISNGKIIESYYCDNYSESEKDFVFKNGIDHERKENCYLRRCVYLPESTLKLISEKRTESLFDAILKNVDEYVSSHGDSDFSSVVNSDIKTIGKNELKQYCENRAFFTKSDFVEDNLNLLSCSEFRDKTVKSANYEDVIFKTRENLDNFSCVNFKTIMRNNIETVNDSDGISFVTDVFATFGGNTNKVSDSVENNIAPDFKFNDNFLRYNEIGERNICKGVDNAMIYISGDIENLNDELDFNDIIDITVNKYFLNRCEIEDDENSSNASQLNKCTFGNKEILNSDENKTKINNIKDNLLKKYFVKNIVDCADYGSKKEDDAENIQRVVDCKLMDFLKRNTQNYKDHYYIEDTYNKCDQKYTSYDNLGEQKLFKNIQTFQASEGKLFLPVPLKKEQPKEEETGDNQSEKSPYIEKMNETGNAVVCGYEGGADYEKFRKTTSAVGCYPLADDSAYIDIAPNYEDLKDKKIVNITNVSKPKDFTFNYIPVFTRYTNVDDRIRTCEWKTFKGWFNYRVCKYQTINNLKQCGERKDGSFNDKLAILTSGNIDTSGEFKYISNDNGYLTAAGHSSSSNFYKYGGGKYGNNICVFVYKDLSNCVTGTFNNFRDIVNRDSLRSVYRDTHEFNCNSYMTVFDHGCSGIGDSYKPTENSKIKYINYDTYQWVLNNSSYQNASSRTFIDGINTIYFKDFNNLFSNNVFTYGGSVKDYYPYNNDYDHGVLAKFNILSSYRGDLIRETSEQDLGFNTNFYKTLNNRYEFSKSGYYKGLTTKDIIKNCKLTKVFQNGQFNPNVLNSDEKLEAARKCLKQYNADFFAKKPNEQIRDFGTVVKSVEDVITAPLKNKKGVLLGGKEKGILKKFAEVAAIKVRIDNNGTNYQPFKMVNYIGNQEEYNEKNINCYFDKYGFPISDLRYCRGIFTTKENVKDFNIYDDSDMKNFLPESQCLKLPLASAPQPYFTLATPYNTPTLFSPIFILTKYIKWDTTNTEVDFKTNGVSGVVANFFNPKLYFSYYFTADESNKLFKNDEENGNNNWSEVEVGETSQKELSTLKFSSRGTGSGRVFTKIFAGKKSFILSDKDFYYPVMCVSTYIDTGNKSLNPVADQCDPKYKGNGDTCVVSDTENFVCVDRMVPTYANIYMRLDKDFSFRKPYINAFIYDTKIDKNEKIKNIINEYYKTDGSVENDNNTNSNNQNDENYKNFVLEGDVEGDPKAIDSKGFNQIQQFGLKFERSLCSQLDIEYFDYLEKLNMLAKDNEAQRTIYTDELEKINEVIKPNCMEAQGNVVYLDKIDITDGNCAQATSSTITADIPTGNVLLPINNTNSYLQCENEKNIGKILDRIKIVKNPVADKGHKEICISDSNFEEMMQANSDQGTFKYSSEENQVVVFNSTISTNVEDNKCLLDSTSRENKNCMVGDFVYIEDNTANPINNDTKGNITETFAFVSESDGSVYRVKKIDCSDAKDITDNDIANIRSFSDSRLEKIKYCYKGGYNYSGNVSKADGSADYSCRCMKKNSITNKGILENGIFSSRTINKRELGLCVDIDNAIPVCEAISYKNPISDSTTSYEEQVKNMKFSKITSLMSDLFKNRSGYEDERWEHIWRNKQKMFNSIGSYSGSSRFLGHAEFARYPYCDDEKGENCFGKSKVSVGTCSGFYKDGTRKVLAECKKVGDKYEFRRTVDSGECVPDSCAGVGYTEVFNNLDTNEESLLNNNKNNKNFTQAELASYSNVQNSLNPFNTTKHNGEVSESTIDNRGLFNGFAAWKETESDVVAVKQDAVECLTGYGPAGTNYIVHKFFPYIKNIEDNIDFRNDFSVDANKKMIYMNDLLKKQYNIFNELVNLSKVNGLSENSLVGAIASTSISDFIYLHDNLPIRFCNQLGNWEESRDIYNNAIKNGDKYINPTSLRYYSKNDYYTDLKKNNDKKYLNNTIITNNDDAGVPVFELVNASLNDGISDYNDSINTKYCERLFCQALNMDDVSDIYGDYNIYNYEYDKGNYTKEIGSGNNIYYVTTEIDRINKYTPWRHLGGANWEATSAPRNNSNELIKNSDSYDTSNIIIDNIINVNNNDKGSTKTMYLKKVNGVCDNRYGYYNRGTKFVLDSFSEQFETLKQKVLSQSADSKETKEKTTVDVKEINAVKIGGAKTTGYEMPFRTCSSIGLWSGVYNSCYRACEMIDMYHTNFKDDKKYTTFKTGKNGDINSYFDEKDSISNGDVVSFNLYPDFDKFRINSKTVVFKITNEEGQETNEEYKLGDYITGGASWPKTVVALNGNTEIDKNNGLRYVEVEGTCDTTNPYNKTFVSNVDSSDYDKSLRPKRRCYEDGTWGPIENLCVLFNVCNELKLNILDLSNLLLQNANLNKMNKVINKKLLAQADCSKADSGNDCYKNTYNVDYINRGFESDGLAERIENRTIQNFIKDEDKRRLFDNSKSDAEIDGILSGEFFAVNAGIHVNPTKTKRSIYVPLNLGKNSSSNFAITYSDSGYKDCDINDETKSCPIDGSKQVGYEKVDFYKMQCDFGATDSLSWKFVSPYLGNYIYPIICDKNSGFGSESKALNRTRLFNNKNLKDNIDNLLMYTKESNFHVLSYLINEDKRPTMFRELTNCKQVSGSEDKCDEHGTMSYSNQNDFSDFNVSLPINKDANEKLEYRDLSSYQHITYCDERYFYNEDPDNRGSDTGYLYRPIVVECSKPDEDSKKGKYKMLNVHGTSESFSAEQCYPRYCGRHFSENGTVNGALDDVIDSKFTKNTVQNNWTLSHNTEYEKNKSKYGEISDTAHKILSNTSNIVQCDKYVSTSRLDGKSQVNIDKAYVLKFTKGVNINEASYKTKDMTFTFYSVAKDGIDVKEWRDKGYVSDISTVCVADPEDITNGEFNGITGINPILQHKLGSLKLNAFTDGDVQFCENLNKGDSCKTILESVIANGETVSEDQNTTTTTSTKTEFADKYCIPLACDGEVNLSDLKEFSDSKKNAKKIYLDYDKYQIGEYVVIENMAGDFFSTNKDRVIKKTDKIMRMKEGSSNVYVMSTYLSNNGNVEVDEKGNWKINKYKEDGLDKFETVSLTKDPVEGAYGLVCQKDSDQYFVAGKIAKPTKDSIDIKTSNACKAYIENISMTALNTDSDTEINKHIKYTDTLKNIATFVNKEFINKLDKEGTTKDAKSEEKIKLDKEGTTKDAKSEEKINELLKTYITNKVDSIKNSFDGEFEKYVAYGDFINGVETTTKNNTKTSTGNNSTSGTTTISNIDKIKDATVKDIKKYYVFTYTSSTENSAGTDSSSSDITTTTHKYIISDDELEKIPFEEMVCEKTNDTYLFETSLCNYNNTKYIKIEEHESFEPNKGTITIEDENITLTYQPNEAMYVLEDGFGDKYKTAFNNTYAEYIKNLLKDDNGVIAFYDRYSSVQLIRTDKLKNSNAFETYDKYADLKDRLIKKYRDIEYLGDKVFEQTNTTEENAIYKKIKEIKEEDKNKFADVNNEVSIDVSKDNINLQITAEITNTGDLSLYTYKYGNNSNSNKEQNVINKHKKFLIILKNYRKVDGIKSIEDLTNNLTIKLDKDNMTNIDGITNPTDGNELGAKFGLTPKEIESVKKITCPSDSAEEPCDVRTKQREEIKNIWGPRNTNNDIIENFNKNCPEKEGAEKTPGCDESDKDRITTIDLSRMNEKAIAQFRPYIEKLIYAGQKLDELYRKEQREDLVDKKTIEENCVVFSDKKINDCYKESGGVCELLTGKSTSQFERLYIEEYQKSVGNTSSAPFNKGLFMALQCGTDGQWKLVGGDNAVQCKERCSGNVEFDLNPEGYGNYEVIMYIKNLRYQSSGQAQVAGVGVYCSRSNDNQSKHGKVYFSCGENGEFQHNEHIWSPGYKYNYNFPNPGVRTTCRSDLLSFNGADGSFSYYRNAATGSVKRNNRGVIITCPKGSSETIIHYVGKGHMCGLDQNDTGDDADKEYPAYHKPWSTFKCKPNLEHNVKQKYECTRRFDTTAKISYDVEEI